MSNLPKPQRFVYEKGFSLSHVLQNLQSYKLATGDVQPSELSRARAEFGDDEGKVYGALVTRAAARSAEGRKRRGSRDRRGGKRRRRQKEECRGQSKGKIGLEERSLPPAKHQPCSSSLRLEAAASMQDHGTPPSTSSLGLLAGYSGSSESEEDSREEAGPCSRREGGGRRPEEKFEIPSSIQAMFSGSSSDSNDQKEQETLPSSGQGEEEEEEEEGLGFFEPVESEESEVEEEAPAKLPVPSVEAKWDEDRSKWVFGSSPFCTYVCWRCNHVGHLPQDCTVRVEGSMAERRMGGSSQPRISQLLQRHYALCREIKQMKGVHCAMCGVHSNLATCLECRSVLCDGRGHLASHLLEHPSHTTLYSHKLERMIKCCKATCEVVNIYDLYMCSHCLGKAFSQHYSMVNATWSGAGLRKMPNALCCEDHFQWHRINCPDASEENLITMDTLRSQSGSHGLISEFFF